MFSEEIHGPGKSIAVVRCRYIYVKQPSPELQVLEKELAAEPGAGARCDSSLHRITNYIPSRVRDCT